MIGDLREGFESVEDAVVDRLEGVDMSVKFGELSWKIVWRREGRRRGRRECFVRRRRGGERRRQGNRFKGTEDNVINKDNPLDEKDESKEEQDIGPSASAGWGEAWH